LLYPKVAIKKNAKEGKPMADETIIRLTDEQKKQMKQATGQEHDEFKVETVGTKLSPRVAPKIRSRVMAKKAAPKKVMAKKAAPKKTMAKKAAPKRTMAKKAAPKRTMAKKVAPKR
jgi:hypothetical protein